MDTETMIYIVTEYASKGDIFDHLVKTGKMSEPDACHVFAQILSAVKYCHNQGKFLCLKKIREIDLLFLYVFHEIFVKYIRNKSISRNCFASDL